MRGGEGKGGEGLAVEPSHFSTGSDASDKRQDVYTSFVVDC